MKASSQQQHTLSSRTLPPLSQAFQRVSLPRPGVSDEDGSIKIQRVKKLSMKIRQARMPKLC